jgi:hypothetical protein
VAVFYRTDPPKIFDQRLDGFVRFANSKDDGSSTRGRDERSGGLI